MLQSAGVGAGRQDLFWRRHIWGCRCEPHTILQLVLQHTNSGENECGGGVLEAGGVGREMHAEGERGGVHAGSAKALH